MKVTKQQQLEWLAKNVFDWPEDSSEKIRVSKNEIGVRIFWVYHDSEFHEITRQEWQQERAKMQKQQDNSWCERGELPPIGTICEMIDDKKTWLECEIIAHKNSFCIGWISSRNAPFYTDDKSEFRPLRTEREKAISEMKSLCAYPGSWNSTYKSFADALYDAGYRKEQTK